MHRIPSQMKAAWVAGAIVALGFSFSEARVALRETFWGLNFGMKFHLVVVFFKDGLVQNTRGLLQVASWLYTLLHTGYLASSSSS